MRSIGLIVLLLFAVNSYGQRLYNEDIRTICRRAHIDTASAGRDTAYTIHTGIGGRLVPVHIVIEDTMIVHVGLSLFPIQLMTGRDRWIYRFAERKLLLYAVLKDEEAILRDMNFNDVVLRGNNGSPLLKLVALASRLTGDTATAVKTVSDSAAIAVSLRGTAGSIVLVFKRNSENILGIDKIEADRRLIRDLQQGRYDARRDGTQIMIDQRDTLSLNDSVYKISGSSYLNCFYSLYFMVRRDQTYGSLYDARYPLPSFITSLINPSGIHSRINVVLTHRQYDHKEYVVTNLNNLVGYLKKDHELYLATNDTLGKMSGILLAYNRSLNYLHLFYLDANEQTLFGSDPEYYCLLYSYIPTHNLSHLLRKKQNR